MKLKTTHTNMRIFIKSPSKNTPNQYFQYTPHIKNLKRVPIFSRENKHIANKKHLRKSKIYSTINL